MAPPGMKKKPSVTVSVGVKPSGPKLPPGMEEEPDMPEAPEDEGGEGGKHSPEEAWVTRADEHCKDCSNYIQESGDCKEVSGYYDPEDSCKKYFVALGGSEEEPDADDMGGPSDNDEDDMPEGADVR